MTVNNNTQNSNAGTSPVASSDWISSTSTGVGANQGQSTLRQASTKMSTENTATCPTSKGPNQPANNAANGPQNLSHNPDDTPKAPHEESDTEAYGINNSDHNLEDWPDSCWGGG